MDCFLYDNGLRHERVKKLKVECSSGNYCKHNKQSSYQGITWTTFNIKNYAFSIMALHHIHQVN